LQNENQSKFIIQLDLNSFGNVKGEIDQMDALSSLLRNNEYKSIY